MNIVNKFELKVSSSLLEFINKEAIPGTNIDQEDFWKNFQKLLMN